jgi:hypothetical protein
MEVKVLKSNATIPIPMNAISRTMIATGGNQKGAIPELTRLPEWD